MRLIWRSSLLHFLYGAYFLLLHIQESIGTSTVSCIKLPGANVPQNTQNTWYAFGDIDRKSYGIEKFPQHVWKKYIVDYEKTPWFDNDNSAKVGYGGVPTPKLLDIRTVYHYEDNYGQFGMEFNTRSTKRNPPDYKAPFYNFSLVLRTYTLHGREFSTDDDEGLLLQGWYRLELSAKYWLGANNDEQELDADLPITKVIKSFILVATDDQANHVGEFTLDFPEATKRCPKNDATKHMIIPCSAIAQYEAIAPNMIVWVRNDTRKDGKGHFPTKYKDQWPIVRNIGSQKTLNFYFRLPFLAAQKTRYKKLFFRLVADFADDFDQQRYHVPEKILVEGLMQVGMRIDFKINVVQGATDPLPSNLEKVDCSARLWNYNYIGFPPHDTGPFIIRSLPDDHRTPWYVGYESNDGPPAGFYYDRGLVPPHMDMLQGYPDCLSRNYFGGRCYTTRCGLSSSYTTTHLLYTGRTEAPKYKNIPKASVLGGPKDRCTTNDNPSCTWTGFFATDPLSLTLASKNLPRYAMALHCFPFLHPLMISKFYENKAVQFKELGKLTTDERNNPSACPKTEDEISQVTDEQKVRRPLRNRTRDGDTNKENPSTPDDLTGNSRIVDPEDYNKDKKDIEDEKEKDRMDALEHAKRKKKKIDIRGVKVYGFGTILYTVRKGHGVAMVVVTIFALPLSLFVSRYCKESFMKTRVISTPPWFQIHIHLSFWICALYIAGTAIAVAGRKFIGVSVTLAGRIHRAIGWSTLLLFTIALFTGAVRCYDEPNRTVSILIHWILGYTIYALNVLCIISSVYIPGSPSTENDVSRVFNESDVDQWSPINNWIYYSLGAWLVYEIVIQIFMTTLIYKYDQEMELSEPRKFIPPVIGAPIPVLKVTSEYDAPGSGARFVILFIHILIAGVVTAAAAIAIIHNKPKDNIGFGPMHCTHKWSPELNRYSIPKSGIDIGCAYVKH